ncbi:hypothetical protein BC831DRAFT_6458 [Entophlyctis helioformis]|nr:hypothetical protein BC831DRAFT_6458 [Entophlyctis helioformis]
MSSAAATGAGPAVGAGVGAGKGASLSVGQNAGAAGAGLAGKQQATQPSNKTLGAPASDTKQQASGVTAAGGRQANGLGADDNAATLSAFSDPASCEPLVMTIKVINAVNIRGSKGEHVNSFIRAQFADFDFKDTSIVVDNSNPDFNLSFDQTFNVDETLIEIFANKVISLTLIESLPKEKTAILGTAELSLYKAFLKYFTREPESDTPIPPSPLVFRETVPVVYANPKLLSPAPESQKTTPECTIEVSLSRPLLRPEDILNGNFVTLRVDDVWPVPDEWTTKEGNEKDINSNIFTYTVNLTLPCESGGERVVSIPNGTIVAYEAPVSTDPSASVPQTITLSDVRKEQSTTDPADGGAGGPSAPQPADDGDQKEVETKESKKIVWGSSTVIYIGPSALERIRKLAHDKRPLEIEFTRVVQAKFASVVDNMASKYRGKAGIDVAMMMYPNVIGIKGRFMMDVVETTDSAILNSTAAIDAPVSHKSKKDPNNIYRNIGTGIGLELMLSAPLIDKKKLQAITKSVTDFIPKRFVPPGLQFEKRSKLAEDNFRTKINEIVHKLVQEYRGVLQMEASMKGEEQSSVNSKSPEDEQQRKKLFMYHLNKSGAYFSFKEQLKASVVQVVRERFRRKSPFASQAELQLFTSEVYVYLIDQMHISINKIFSEKDVDFVDPTINRSADFGALKEFADAAELNRQPNIAAMYHQERVAKYNESLSAWFDYGCFAMRNSMSPKGEECFKEILSRNPKHIPTLLVYGAICTAHERFEEARVYLSTAVQLEPRYALANTFLGIFYEIISEDAEAEKYLAEARQITEDELQDDDGPTHFSKAAEFAIQAHVGEFADVALSQELLIKGPSVRPYLLLSQLEIQRGGFNKAADHLKEALDMEHDNVAVWSALGHLQFIQNKFSEAKHSYETVMSLRHDERSIVLIYIRLGAIYLRSAYAGSTSPSGSMGASVSPFLFIKNREESVDVSNALIAKNMYLKACAIAPSAQSWLGAGKTCFALKEYQEAEDAFAEANVLNNRDSEVWAYLALLSLTLGHTVEANQAIAQALRLGIKDGEILKALGAAFMNESQPTAAVECLRMALEQDPNDFDTRDLFVQALDKCNRSFLAGANDTGNAAGQLTDGSPMTQLQQDELAGVRSGFSL